MTSRCGYSLIELVVALMASTALVASLAATIVISTRLIETPPDDQSLWHDRAIIDRLAADLRYATDVDETPVGGFQITRPDAVTGNSQTISYQTGVDGLTRQVDAGPVIPFDSDSPGQQFQVDGYTAATAAAPGNVARVRSTSAASSTGLVSSLDIDLPPGCQGGDLLILCIAAKTPTSLTISNPGWLSLSSQAVVNLRSVNGYRFYAVTLPGTISIDATPDSAIAAAMIAVENVDTTSPINWSDIYSGYAWPVLPQFNPVPLETSGFSPGQLNVQIFAGDGDPWPAGTLGIASFTDVARATGGTGTSSETSIGIAVRTGPMPSMTGTPQLWQKNNPGHVLQTGVRLEVLP